MFGKDNNKLIGLAFDMDCGCTIVVEDIVASICIRNRDDSKIFVKVRVHKHCAKLHRNDIDGNIFFQEYEKFMDQMYSSYRSELPKVNTITSMKEKKNR